MMTEYKKTLSEALLLAREVEAKLRATIKQDLKLYYGVFWQDFIPDTLIEIWVERKTKADDLGDSDREELIEYTTISESIDLINRYWDSIFILRFEKQEYTKGLLEDYRKYRNKLMHAVDMAFEECQEAIFISKKILEFCNKPVIFKEESTLRHDSHTKRESEFVKNKAGTADALLEFETDVKQLLENMTGVLNLEKTLVLNLLRSHPKYLTEKVILQFFEKFSNIDGTQEQVEDLFDLVPPRYPADPAPSWKTKKWLNWVDREYLPYRTWSNRLQIEDQKLDALAQEFEKWLVNKYPELISKNDQSLVSSIYKIVEDELDHNNKVVWLVVDNLNFEAKKIMRDYLESLGFEVKKYRRMLSMIPSITAISRKSLLSGRLPVHAKDYKTEEHASKQLWEDLGYSNIKFCTDIYEYRNAVTSNADLIILVVNTLDALAHMPEDNWVKRPAFLELAVKNIVDEVVTGIIKLDAINKTSLVVSTDHGSIMPGKNSEKLILPEYLKDYSIKEYHRYVKIPGSEKMVQEDWYYLNADDFGLESNYAVPKYQNYINTYPRGFAHGGVSPEEVFVSTLVLSKSKTQQSTSLGMQFFILESDIRIGKVNNLKIKITNTLLHEIEDLKLTFKGYDLSIGTFALFPQSELIEDFSIMIPKHIDVVNEVAYLNFSYSYLLTGRKMNDSGTVKIKIKSLYTSALDDMGDLFG